MTTTLTNDLRQYVETALWSSIGDDEKPLDDDYSILDIHSESLKRMAEDLISFREQASDLLNNLDDETVAHDFWLTRNRHGAGFLDGDYDKKIGEKLTELSTSFGEQHLEIGDDKMIHILGA